MPYIRPLTAEGKIEESISRMQRDLRQEMQENKITFTKVARLLDISPQAVSQQFEKGNHISFATYVTVKMLINGEI